MSSLSVRSQMKQCVCIKCKNLQNEVLIYEEPEVSHILYGVLTLIFFPLAIIWYLGIRKNSNHIKSNISAAVSKFKCEQCGGNLMVLNH